jgi:hypothetical protein
MFASLLSDPITESWKLDRKEALPIVYKHQELIPDIDAHKAYCATKQPIAPEQLPIVSID